LVAALAQVEEADRDSTLVEGVLVENFFCSALQLYRILGHSLLWVETA
jgi:hypothetical protein